jgi:mannose-6-phosphate isomerase-like protein (cupin superfamily)
MSLPFAPSVVSEVRPLAQYTWGNNCEAWSFVDNKDATIKLERMPAGAEEELHYHKQAQQFFYVTKGKAVFEVDEVILIVHEGEGLHIEAGRQHKIMNKEEEQTLDFIVFSHPSTDKDRYNLV